MAETRLTLETRLKLETTLSLVLPTNFEKYDTEMQSLLIAYLSQLGSIEKQAYMIAKDHLGSSFNIVKSNGFCDWKKEHKK